MSGERRTVPVLIVDGDGRFEELREISPALTSDGEGILIYDPWARTFVELRPGEVVHVSPRTARILIRFGVAERVLEGAGRCSKPRTTR